MGLKRENICFPYYYRDNSSSYTPSTEPRWTYTYRVSLIILDLLSLYKVSLIILDLLSLYRVSLIILDLLSL